MSKPLIALTAGHDYADAPGVASVGIRNINAIEENGGIAVIVSGRPESAADIASRVDGLILTGGCDVDPALYGQEMNGTLTVDARRDAFEMALCREIIRQGKPVLGICRGIQMLNVALGGTLVQDIPSWLHVDHPSARAVRHPAVIDEDSFLAPELTGTWTVNSTHHQSVDRPGEGMKVVATSAEGRINEAIQAIDGRPIWGVQWHPERLREEDPVMDSIFKKLIAAASK